VKTRTRIRPIVDIDAERAVVGAMLISPVAVTAARDVLTAVDFSKPSLGHVFRAILDLADHDEAVGAIHRQRPTREGRRVIRGVTEHLRQSKGFRRRRQDCCIGFNQRGR
jgi:DnaB-like helicase N terminal domain